MQGAAVGHGRAPTARCRRAAWLTTFDPCYCRHLRQQILNVGTNICVLHQLSRVLDLQTCSTESGSGLSEACVTAWPSGLHAMFLEWQEYKASPPAGHLHKQRTKRHTFSQQHPLHAIRGMVHTKRAPRNAAEAACSGLLCNSANPNVLVSSAWLHCITHQSCMLYWRHGAAAAWQGPTVWAPCGGPQWLRRGWPAPSLVHRLAVHSEGAASQPEHQQTWHIRRWPADRLAALRLD